MIVKSMPKSLARRKTFRSVDFFRNECNFYEVVLKKYAEFQLAKGVPNAFSGVASLVFCVCCLLYQSRNHSIALISNIKTVKSSCIVENFQTF